MQLTVLLHKYISPGRTPIIMELNVIPDFSADKAERLDFPLVEIFTPGNHRV